MVVANFCTNPALDRPQMHRNLKFSMLAGRAIAAATGPLEHEDLLALNAHPECKLVLCYLDGWTGENLDFLERVPRLRQLQLLVNKPVDVTSISRLRELESLELLSPTSGKISPEALQSVRHAEIRWQIGLHGLLDSGALEHLVISHYPGHDLGSFSALKRLRLLQLDASRLRSSAGVAPLTNLSVLRLRGCRRMTCLVDLAQLHHLDSLDVEGSSQLTSLAEAFRAQSLRVLHAGDCPRISSVAGIDQLCRLEEVYLDGTTRVGDCDLSPLLRIPSLRKLCVAWRPGYRPSLAAFEHLIPA